MFTTVFSYFWEKLHLFFVFLSSLSFSSLNVFKMKLCIPYEPSIYLIFVNQPDSLIGTSSLKAFPKLQFSFTNGFLYKYLNICVSMLIRKETRASSTITSELLFALFLTPNICLHSDN